MTRSVMIWILIVAVHPWSAAYACSCRPGITLREKYERADNVLIAKILGCAPDRLSADGFCRSHGWKFETVENLKGSAALIQVHPSDAGPAVDTCDISLKVGDTYLLFLEQGRTYQCSGTHSLSGDTGSQTMSEVVVLRAYRDGAIARVTNPWHFSDSGRACAIEHQLDGAYLRFHYQYALPPMAVQQGSGALSKPVPNMTLWLVQPFNFVGPALLEVNGDPVPLTRITVQPTRASALAVDAVYGDAALALLDTMSQPVDVVVSGDRSTPRGAAEPFRATTQTTQVAEVAAKFKACIAAHSGLNDERK